MKLSSDVIPIHPVTSGFRFLRSPVPAVPWAFLAVRCPLREDYGFTTFRLTTRIE